ncbi:MAG: hypothetical protein WD232_00770, partial [Acidimicrobiales bacterium]
MPTASSPIASRAKLLKVFRILAGLIAGLVLVQAWMAGHSDLLFGELSIVAHGIVGNISYLFAVGALVVAIVARANKAAVGVAAAIVVLMTVQIGLGYTGRESNDAAAWHIPIGVTIFGLAIHQVSVARALARGTAAFDA